MRKAKYANYSFTQMSEFINSASSFEEVLEQMGYSVPNNRLTIASVRRYCDTLHIEHNHLPDILDTDTIQCNVCRQEKDRDHYYFSNGKLGQKVCKECVRSKQNEKYNLQKEFLHNYKRSHHCVKCGCSKFYLIDFHHLDPKEKDYTIANNHTAKIETIIKEIEKCITLCANCHREFHYLEKKNKITIKEYLEGYPSGEGGSLLNC